MKLETVGCYICGEESGGAWGEENGFTMRKCARCGLVYLSPRPVLGDIDEAARTGLHRFAAGALNAVGTYSGRKVNVYTERLRELVPGEYLTQPGASWLDVGAGHGELVEAVTRLSPSMRALGIEPCEAKVRGAKRHRLPVTATPLGAMFGKFSFVSLINVYSHLPDPVGFFRDLRRLLADAGSLLVVTGNGGDIARDEYPGALYLPDHLSFAGRDNLAAVLDAAGFSVSAVREYPETASLDVPAIAFAKNIARRVTGRPTVPLRPRADSRFRSLWMTARMRPIGTSTSH